MSNPIDLESLSEEALVALALKKRSERLAKEEAERAAKGSELTDRLKKLLAEYPEATVKSVHKDLFSALTPFAPAPAAPAKGFPKQVTHPTPEVGAVYGQSGDNQEYRLHVLGAKAFKISRTDGAPLHEGLPSKYQDTFESVSAAAEAATADKRLRGTWVVDETGWLDTAGAGQYGKPPSVNGWAFWKIG